TQLPIGGWTTPSAGGTKESTPPASHAGFGSSAKFPSNPARRSVHAWLTSYVSSNRSVPGRPRSHGRSTAATAAATATPSQPHRRSCAVAPSASRRGPSSATRRRSRWLRPGASSTGSVRGSVAPAVASVAVSAIASAVVSAVATSPGAAVLSSETSVAGRGPGCASAGGWDTQAIVGARACGTLGAMPSSPGDRPDVSAPTPDAPRPAGEPAREAGHLVLGGTPIGNAEDASPRLRRLLA